ncbi:E3 ubiquitin ligase rnf-5-like protein [Drosera capensis]
MTEPTIEKSSVQSVQARNLRRTTWKSNSHRLQLDPSTNKPVIEVIEMASGFQESTSGSRANASDSGDFECNICFDLAQDPIVTLCGHLFCWPCLYKWLRHHSQSHECPVCKALVQEDKLVPLYGRGKKTSDPRSRPVPGDIPNRPSGQRPQTAPSPLPTGAGASYFPNISFGLLGGFVPMATVGFGNMTMSAGFGGLLPSIVNFHFNAFSEPAPYGATHGYPPGYGSGFHGGDNRYAARHQRVADQAQDLMVFSPCGYKGASYYFSSLSWNVIRLKLTYRCNHGLDVLER